MDVSHPDNETLRDRSHESGAHRAMNIAYFIKRPLEARDLERFGIDHFMEKGCTVRVFDLGNIIHPEIGRGPAEDFSERDVVPTVFRDLEDFKAAKDAIGAADLIVMLIESHGLYREIVPVMRMVTRLGVPYLVMMPTPVPGVIRDTGEITTWRRIRRFFERLGRLNVANSILARIPCRAAGIAPAGFAVFNSELTMRQSNFIGPETKPIYAQTHDYDLAYHEATRGTPLKEQAVFIDQFMPFHPDAIANNLVGKIDPEQYFRRMRRLFDRVEEQFGLKVVVALHPRADYPDGASAFGNRELIRNQTARLIGESRLVISHMSTSLGIAVVCRKPILLIAAEDLYNNHVYHKYIFDDLARRLGVPLNFMDDPDAIDLSSALAVDEARYDRYIRDFLKHPKAADKPLWDIVHDEVAAALPVH